MGGLFILAENLCDGAGVSERLVHLNILIHELFKDVKIVLDHRIGGLFYEIMDVWGLLLPIAVNTSVTLLQYNERPGDVVIEHPVTKIVEVNAL